MPGVVSVAGAIGYGGRPGTVSPNASHDRATASFAGSWRAMPWLAVGLRLDGRYDRHSGLAGDGETDDNTVLDPRLFVRARRSVGGALAIGADVSLWAPSDSAVEFDGVSPDVRGLASYRLSDAWVVAGNLGFRLDRSARSVVAPERLSDADRFSLGASESNAVLFGAAAMWSRGRATVTADWSLDLLVGSDAPAASESPMRVGTEVRWRVGQATWVRGGLEVGLSSTPAFGADDPLAPVEMRYSGWLGVGYRFGGASESKRPRGADVESEQQPGGPVITGAIAGVVVDGVGNPVRGAQVSVGIQVVTSGADGAFRLEGLPLGEATIEVRVDGFRPHSAVVAVTAHGPNGPDATIASTRLELTPNLPPGQLRGLVRTIKGAPLRNATVSVEPLGVETAVDSQGQFRIDVPPGSYVLIVRAPGYARQSREVTVEEDGVTVLNAELRRRRR